MIPRVSVRRWRTLPFHLGMVSLLPFPKIMSRDDWSDMILRTDHCHVGQGWVLRFHA